MFRYALLAILLSLTTGFSGCSSTGGISTQRQRIATACESAASAEDAIAAGARAGKVTQAQLATSIRIYQTTVAICEPVPATTLDAVKYAALSAAVAELVTLQGALK